MRQIRLRSETITLLLVLAVAVLLAPSLRGQSPEALKLSGDYPVTHDPAIGREGNNYYVFATTADPADGQFPIRCSSDLHNWKLCGRVFDRIPEWIHKVSPGTKVLWAPDISWFNGKYHLYYAYSLFGVNTSGIALATNEALDPRSAKYHWHDEGLVLQSTYDDNFNAIDPNIVLDDKGQPWLSFGSFWGGIKMRRIDSATGKPSKDDPTLYALAARVKPENAEAAKPGLPAGNRGSFYRSSWRLLLSLCLFRFVLPRNSEQLPNNGWEITQCDRPLRRRRWQTYAARRWHTDPLAEWPMAWARRRICFAPAGR